MNVEPLHRCRCGQAGTPRDVALRGRKAGEIIVCDRCLAKSVKVLEWVKPVFDKMIEIGIKRPDADATMTFLLERIG